MLILTSNQIAYWTMKEQERSNRAKESETARHNKADEYNKLIGALDNVFSLGAHAAGGNPNANEGIISQLKSVFGEDTTIGNIIDSASTVLKDPVSIFSNGSVEPIVTTPGRSTSFLDVIGNIGKMITNPIGGLFNMLTTTHDKPNSIFTTGGNNNG